MELLIKKHQSSVFLSRYSIFKENNLIFSAKASILSENPEINLYNTQKAEVGLISKEISVFPEFTLSFNGGFHSYVKGIRSPSNKLILNVPTGIVELHHQKGLTIAIFENENQIATIKRQRFNFLSANNYILTANSNICVEFLILLVIGWDWTNNYGIKLLPINFNFIGRVERKEQKDWIPI